MESCDILSDYLLSRSSLDSILTFEKFKNEVKKETNKSLSPRLLKLVYDSLSKQRNDMVIDVIQYNIKELFDIPVDKLTNSTHNITLDSILDLLTRLSTLSSTFEIQNDLHQYQIDLIIDCISNLIQQLRELKNGKLPNENINEIVVGVSKLQSYLNLKS